MKKNNPPKKLWLFKRTIAHLNNEQMLTARGGEGFTKLLCSDPLTGTETENCHTIGCKDSDTKSTKICA
jgi:hypothetical protein